MCQLKLPQQVALTEFKGQVSATVKVIIVTRLNYEGMNIQDQDNPKEMHL